jgi:curved DNA-binding protein CbpA
MHIFKRYLEKLKDTLNENFKIKKINFDIKIEFIKTKRIYKVKKMGIKTNFSNKIQSHHLFYLLFLI